MHQGPHHTNGQPPGVEAPIRLALTRVFTFAEIPRELFGGLIALLAGGWMLYPSWGWVVVGVGLYGYMVYRTKQDPWWVQIAIHYLAYWVKLHPEALMVLGFAIILGGTIMIALMLV